MPPRSKNESRIVQGATSCVEDMLRDCTLSVTNESISTPQFCFDSIPSKTVKSSRLEAENQLQASSNQSNGCTNDNVKSYFLWNIPNMNDKSNLHPRFDSKIAVSSENERQSDPAIQTRQRLVMRSATPSAQTFSSDDLGDVENLNNVIV